MTTIVGRYCTTGGGFIEITIKELSTDRAANTSQVSVVGKVYNKGTGTSTHTTANISCSITSSSGDGSFTGANWAIGIMGPGSSKTFISHTFTVTHDSDGTKTVSFSIHFGVTGTTIFGDNQEIGGQLTLTQLSLAPSPPQNVAVSNVLPTSFTLSWDPPDDDGGAPVDFYGMFIYEGQGIGSTPTFKTTSDTSTTINLTSLKSATYYTFLIYAHNGFGDNNGYSQPSDQFITHTLAGCWIRDGGVWKIGVPYVRDGGVWKMALPHIRVAGVWQSTN